MKLFSDSKLRKRFAKIFVRDAMRNTILEDYHAGKFPSSKTGDYSDVKVVSPFGEIPWNELSRISDEEMKRLMQEVVDKTYTMMLFLSKDEYVKQLEKVLRQRDFMDYWDDPTFLKGQLWGGKRY